MQDYGGEEAKKGLGLGRVTRMESYRGFVFGSFAAEGPTLGEHLGSATDAFDRLARLSPVGEVKGHRRLAQAQGQGQLEDTDGERDGRLPPQFVHSSIFEVARSGIGMLYSDKSAAVSRDMGNGHTENELRPEFRGLGVPMGWFGTTAERMPEHAPDTPPR